MIELVTRCHRCRSEGKNLSIVVASGPSGDDDNKLRYYLPNQTAREIPDMAGITTLFFCRDCMRTIEDVFRAAITPVRT
jgi:hypothetical protein